MTVGEQVREQQETEITQLHAGLEKVKLHWASQKEKYQEMSDELQQLRHSHPIGKTSLLP